jgi:hypothetical protein
MLNFAVDLEPAIRCHPQAEDSRAHPGLSEDAARCAGRLSHARCQGRRALCRQGQEPQEARGVLCQDGRPQRAHRAHGGRYGRDAVRHHGVRNRSAAARIQSDQAAEAALQCFVPRRQILSQHPAARRPSLCANPQASRREIGQRRLFRAFRVGRRRQPHAQCAAARVPAALVLGFRVRIAHAAVPAVPDQALQRALHGRIDEAGLQATRRRGRSISHRQEPRGAGGACGRHERGVGALDFERAARLRDRLARSAMCRRIRA